MHLAHTTHIDAPPARVWALTLDVQAWPDTTSTMTSIERLDDGPLAPGSTARVRQPAQRARVWTVTAVEPEHRFAWATQALGGRLTGTHTLVADGGGTANTLALDTEGRLAGVLGRLLAPALKRSLAEENAGFKAAAEATPAPAPSA